MKRLFSSIVILFNLVYLSNAQVDNQSSDNQPVFRIVEVSPTFPRGTNKCIEFINTKMNELISSSDIEIEGKVITKITINSSGKIVDIKILKGLCKKQDDIAIKIIESMPDWIPGKNRSRPIESKFTLPINFKK